MYNVYMPNVTVYIRRADLDKFKALPNKAEFISNALNSGRNLLMERIDPKALNYDVPARAAVQPIIKTKDDAVEAVKQLFPDAKVVTPLFRDKKNKKL